MRTKITMYLLSFLLTTVTLFANNVQVANISITGQNNIEDYKMIEFDVSWENSWRTTASPNNWDAVWVFAKYRLTNGTRWNHVTLHDTSNKHSTATGSQMDAVPNGTGVFIYRNADGSGTNNFINNQLRWEYGIDGLADNDSVEICVFAIEMVYVPEGGYTLGDGNGVATSYNSFEVGTSNLAPVIGTALVSDIRSGNISTYDDIQLYSTGIGIEGDGGLDNNDDGVIDNPDFPTGYKAFYCMKYEITQGQYCAFANKLTSAQAAARITTYTSARHTITGSALSPWAAATENRANGRLDWYDYAAYCDWSGLRVMTELEYEKAARGTLPAILGEYAWGTTNIHTTPYTMSFDGTSSEGVTNIGTFVGNCNYSVTDPVGPMRVGIFAATSTNNTREETGGSYYGIMELAGNVWELTVTVGHANGRAFNGLHGDGVLDAAGFANQATWLANLNGTGLRGGGYSATALLSRVSARNIGGLEVARGSEYGGRAVRSAPAPTP